MASVLQVIGLAAIVVGAALFSPVTGFIVGGLAVVAVGIVMEKPNAS